VIANIRPDNSHFHGTSRCPAMVEEDATASPSVDASPQPNELSQTIHLLLTLFNILHWSLIAAFYIDETENGVLGYHRRDARHRRKFPRINGTTAFLNANITIFAVRVRQ
jgi:hypothetical protein